MSRSSCRSSRFFCSVEVRDVVNLSERNPFICLPDTSSLMDIVLALQREHVHRVGIKNAAGTLVNYVSESRLLSYILSQKQSELSTKKMEELNVHNLLPHPKLFVSVTPKTKAVNAFSLMSKEHVSALPVLDENGKVLANISAKDLKIIGLDGHARQLMYLPVLEYLGAHEKKRFLSKIKHSLFSSASVVSYHKEDIFVEVVQRLVSHNVHRIYYTDKTGKLYGIVSIKDFLSAIAGRRAGEGSTKA